MSRFYEMGIKIIGLNKDRKAKIEAAAEENWPFSDWFLWEGTEDKDKVELSAGGQSTLSGGMSEEEFAQIVCEAVWKANKAFCEVTVNATFLEDLPYETYSFDEDNYQMFCDMGCTQEEEEEALTETQKHFNKIGDIMREDEG